MPESRFVRKARQEIEDLGRREAARKRAHNVNPGQIFDNLSFQEKMAALYPPQEPTITEKMGSRPATPAEIARMVRRREIKP